MPTRLRRWTVGVLALVAMAAVTSTSAANTITAEPSGGITKTSEGEMRIRGTGGIEINIECRVTFRGTVNRTINNAREGSVGQLTEGRADSCGAFNSMGFAFSAGWPIRLSGSARLELNPDLIDIQLNGFRLEPTVLGVRCTYQGTVPEQLEAEGSPAVTRRFRILANSVSLSSGLELCPERVELAGEFRFTIQTLRL